uniref:Polyprenal reductase n=1 Tax=Trichuris muris TaxID=70415 RepID=A0A5S6QPE6_TRIMR
MFLSWVEAFWLLCSVCIFCPGVVVIWAPNSSPLLNRLLTYGKVQVFRRADLLSILEVPKRWFTHFYIVATLTSEVALTVSVLHLTRFVIHDAKPIIILQDLLSFLRQPVGTIETMTSAPPPRLNEATIVLCCVLFFVQALRRFFESAFLSVYSDTKMNIFHYLLGVVHYIMIPCSILVEGPSLTTPPVPQIDASAIVSPVFLLDALKQLTLMQWFGVGLFIWASLKQHECFRILSAMRRGYSGHVVTHSHGIPHGGWFDYVACPHFFFEILIYLSIWCCQNLTWNTWSFVVVFVIVNQMIAASITREWYMRKFPEIFPSNRTALIPYIF